MADNSVFITGAAKGSLAEALDGLPPWSTQETTAQIEKWLRKSYDIQSKMLEELKNCCNNAGAGNGGGQMSARDVENISNALDKLTNSLSKQNEELEKSRKKQAAADREKSESNKKLISREEVLGKFFTGLVAVGSKVTGVFKDYVDTYDSLYQSGINLMNGYDKSTSGFAALNEMVTLTGMRLQTLQAVAEKYTTTINSVGMMKFAKTISMANTQLRELGFYGQNQAELIATLMESEMGYADIRNKTAAELAEDAVKLGDQLSRLSQTVGLSRQQLQESIKATAKSTESSFAMAIYGKEAADKLNRSMAGIKDEGLKKMMMELAVAPNAAMVKGYTDLVSSGMGDIAEQIRATAKLAMSEDPEIFQKKLSELTSILEKQTGRMAAQAFQMGGPTAAGAELYNRLLIEGRSKSQATPESAKNAADTQASIARMNAEFERAASIPQMLFHPLEKQLDIVSSSLKKFNDAVISGAASIESETRSWIGVGLIVAGLITSFIGASRAIDIFSKIFTSGPASNMPKAVSTVGGAVTSFGTLVTRLLLPIAGLFTVLKLGEAIGESIYEMLTGFETSVNLLSLVGGTLVDWVKSAGNWILDGVKSIGTYIRESAPTLYNILTSAFDNIGEFLSKVASKFANKMSFGLLGSSSTEISIPKSPTPSTVQSPASAAPVKQPVSTTDGGQTISTSTLAGIERPNKNSDINSLLVNQGLLLEQILVGTNNLVSVNKDILKYARNSA